MSSIEFGPREIMYSQIDAVQGNSEPGVAAAAAVGNIALDSTIGFETKNGIVISDRAKEEIDSKRERKPIDRQTAIVECVLLNGAETDHVEAQAVGQDIRKALALDTKSTSYDFSYLIKLGILKTTKDKSSGNSNSFKVDRAGLASSLNNRKLNEIDSSILPEGFEYEKPRNKEQEDIEFDEKARRKMYFNFKRPSDNKPYQKMMTAGGFGKLELLEKVVLTAGMMKKMKDLPEEHRKKWLQTMLNKGLKKNGMLSLEEAEETFAESAEAGYIKEVDGIWWITEMGEKELPKPRGYNKS